MEKFDDFSIHDIRCLRLIEEQSKAARKTDGIDDEFTKEKRLCLAHMEMVSGHLIRLIEEENESF